MKKLMVTMFLGISFWTVAVVPARADFDAGLTAFRQQNYTEALAEFKKCDSAKAKFYLSLMYGMGWGVPRSKEKSVSLMRQAKDQERAEAQPVVVAGSR